MTFITIICGSIACICTILALVNFIKFCVDDKIMYMLLCLLLTIPAMVSFTIVAIHGIDSESHEGKCHAADVNHAFIEEVKNDKDFQSFECYKWKPAPKKAVTVTSATEVSSQELRSEMQRIEDMRIAADKRIADAIDARKMLEDGKRRSHRAVLVKVPGGWCLEPID